MRAWVPLLIVLPRQELLGAAALQPWPERHGREASGGRLRGTSAAWGGEEAGGADAPAMWARHRAVVAETSSGDELKTASRTDAAGDSSRQLQQDGGARRGLSCASVPNPVSGLRDRLRFSSRVAFYSCGSERAVSGFGCPCQGGFKVFSFVFQRVTIHTKYVNTRETSTAIQAELDEMSQSDLDRARGNTLSTLKCLRRPGAHSEQARVHDRAAGKGTSTPWPCLGMPVCSSNQPPEHVDHLLPVSV